jgi:pimeloyl-ACP methyl ester carboxylesterase
MTRRLAALAVCLLVPGLARGAESRFFDSNGVKIHYTVEGKGEPLVLVHGFAVNVTLQWGPVIRALGSQYQIIALDNRGHGRSGKPHDPKQYGMQMVEDVVRLMDHLKVKKAHVAGYSLGAFVTLKMLATHPDRFVTATLGGAGLGDPKEVGFLDKLGASIERGNNFGPLIERLNPPGRPKPTEQEIKSTSQFLAALNDTKALAAAIRGMKELVVDEEKLKAIKVPTLAMVGDQDPLKDTVDALRGKLPNYRTVVIEGADHLNAFARPEFSRTLRTFLADHALDAKPVLVPNR